MTVSEKELLLAYLANQGLRYENDVQSFWDACCRGLSPFTAEGLFGATIRKQVFDKVLHDICALLNL